MIDNYLNDGLKLLEEITGDVEDNYYESADNNIVKLQYGKTSTNNNNNNDS